MDREDIILIGIPCEGMIDSKKINKKFPRQTKNVDVKEDKDNIIIDIDGKSHKIPKKDLLFDKCKSCEYPTPIIYDHLIGNEIKSSKNEDYKDISEFEKIRLEIIMILNENIRRRVEEIQELMNGLDAFFGEKTPKD